MSRLSTLSVTELESVLTRYPWFTMARKELYLRTSLMGEEYRKLGMKRAGVYVPSREKLAVEGFRQPVRDENQRKNSQNTRDINRDMQAVRVIGGDWFSQEDLKSVGASIPVGTYMPPESTSVIGGVIPPVTDEIFYTETLARIYSEQELHQMAIDVYEKLILIYPEKSTYFAALVQEQKKYL